MQESNQRKSGKNNASSRKLATRTPLFFRAHAHGICLMIFYLRKANVGAADSDI
jgi:hypothetical protein